MNFTRESIFLSSIRYFCNAFFSFFGVVIALVVVLVASAMFVGPKFSSRYKTETVLAPDANNEEKLLPETTPAILRVNIHGVIGTRHLNTQTIETMLRHANEGLLKGKRVKGILLHMDTPGGTAQDSDGIYRALKRFKKKHQIPVYAYVEGLCASGGIYISSAADRTYSSPVGIIGSVGVVLGPFFNYKLLMEKYGVDALTLTKGIDKDMLNPFRKWEKGEDQSLVNIMNYEYNRFVQVATDARPRLNKEKLINEYGAQIYDPIKAQEYGYIDQANADYATALTDLVEKANLNPKEPYQVVEILIKPSLINEFLDSKYQLFGSVVDKLENPLNLKDPSKNKVLYYFEM